MFLVAIRIWQTVKKCSVRMSEERETGAPDDDDEEVENVPEVAQVGVVVEHEAEREDLEHRLGAEDGDEVHLRFVLHVQCAQHMTDRVLPPSSCALCSLSLYCMNP